MNKLTKLERQEKYVSLDKRLNDKDFQIIRTDNPIKQEELGKLKVLDLSNSYIKDDSVTYSKDTNKDSYCVLYSGGFDSTSIIIRHLEKGEIVYPYWVDINQHLNERIIAELTINKLREKFPYLLHSLSNIGGVTRGSSWESRCLNQQQVVAFFSSFIDFETRQSAKAVEIGYCMNDCALSFLDELVAIYDKANVLKGEGYENLAPLTFPVKQKEHSNNVDTVYKFQTDYNIELPVFCSELAQVWGYDYSDTHILLVLNPDGETKKKESYRQMIIYLPKTMVGGVNYE